MTARRLLKASGERFYDPEVDVDWDAPPVEGKAWLPEGRVSLHGTAMWAAMSAEQRAELGKQEMITLMSVIIHAELSLVRSLTRSVQEARDLGDSALYALTEVADECRHATMFARAIQAMGGTVVPQSILATRLLNVFTALVPFGPFYWAGALFFEEPVDRVQRQCMADESLQPLVRMVSRIHVVEESRHVAYAREAVRRTLADAGPVSRWVNRVGVALLALSLKRSLLRPDTYRRAGLDPKAAHRAAMGNPHHHESLRWMTERLVAYCRETGLLRGRLTMALWRKSGLLG
ncbi:AurF N-oxygenase family protein [Actinokineospora inagensis]|uniref:AurF N-oxygenase family protein n=1 Tax=Actinokineospora inagensis TaxID=103730 RepID=UPI00040CD681|nr:diiron oxygenase [Actinokineospora inagensis]